jgi:hypothetical protein
MVLDVPRTTFDWLTAEDNPAVAVMTRRLFGEPPSPELDALWARRNEYEPVTHVLAAMRDDGSWAEQSQNYRKYTGSLWQIHFLGELHASGDDERVKRAADHAFSQQLDDGSFSMLRKQPSRSVQCLTANVARALARLGYARDERIVAALGYVVAMARERGVSVCAIGLGDYSLNGYCHMLAPKLLLFLAEVPKELWPDGAAELRDGLVARLREKSVYRCLPDGAREFGEAVFNLKPAEAAAFRERYLAEHAPLTYGPKPGWLRFGYPLSYNSDVLEALCSLAAVGEPMRDEYAEALAVVRDAADTDMRWTLRNSFNGKMLADVEKKGQPSKWLTLRALEVLQHFGETATSEG